MSVLRSVWIGLAPCVLAFAWPNSTYAQLDEADDASELDSEASEQTPAPPPSPDGVAAESEPPTGGEPAIRAQAALGGGLGTRSFERPTPIGAQRLPTATFAAADVALRVDVWPNAAFSLGIGLRYQTSLGLEIEEKPPFALTNRADARAERLEIGVAPTFRLGDARDAPALALPVGFTLRTFWPEIRELMTPGYSLAGPQLRAELVVQLELLTLRIGPEVQWIIAIDESLQDGGVGAQGVAFGGEALLQLKLTSVFAIEVTYRESHALAPSEFVGVADFEDVERFVTARVAGTL